MTKSAITDQAGLSHINTGNLSSKDSQQALNPIISNDFTNQKSQLEKELGGQVTITAAFDGERRRIRSEYAKEAEDRREEAKNLPDGDPNKLRLEAKAQKIERNIRLFDGLASALYTPNTGGAVGDVARAVSPHMAYKIGQYFKSNDYENTQDNQNRPGEQSLQHLMAHAILGAATSYATGQDIGIGALSAVSSETAAPALSKFLFGKDSKELTQDEKDTITNIITLATASTAYTITDGDVAGSVSATEVGRVGVGNNSVSGWDNFFYQIGGGEEYAKSQASLATYCNNQGGDLSKCIQSQGDFTVDQPTQSKNQNLPFLFYVMPEHVTPFLSGDQRDVAQNIKPIVKSNREIVTVTGYIPYTAAFATTQPEITANAVLGAVNNTMLYYQTTPSQDVNGEKAAVYAFGGALTGGVASKANSIKSVAVITGIGYGGSQLAAEGYIDPVTTTTATTMGAYEKYIGNFGCGALCQNSIVTPISNTATTIVDKAEIDKSIGTRIDLRPTSLDQSLYQIQKPKIKPTMPVVFCKKMIDGVCVSD